MSSTDEARPRRRVRVAHAILRRVQNQRDAFAAAYGQATTAQARFNAAATALRAAASERNQRGDRATARRLDELTDQITALLDELHEAQERRADRVLRADARRIARNERTLDDHGNHNPGAEPERERSGRTAAA